MPQSSAVLTSQAAGYIPLAQGLHSERPNPLQGMPIIGHGGMGGIAGMAMTPQIYRSFGQVGMVPMGIGHDQNVYDILQRQRFSAAQQDAMRHAAESDRESFFKTFRGMAAITGTPFGAEQRRAANALAGGAVMAAPMLAGMLPEFVDQMGGARGSATVMAHRMMEAGRYRIDPTTGRMGMQASSVGNLTSNIMADLYSRDNIGKMQGMTAGQMGGLFQQLQQRGMLATGMSGENVFGPVPGRGMTSFGTGDFRANLVRAVDDTMRSGDRQFRDRASKEGVNLKGGAFSLSAGDLDKLQMDPAIAARLEAFDADKVKRSLKAYTHAVSAMRDVFGDIGRPNAPMQELVAGLEAMTLGSMGQMDPKRVGAMARQTHNLAKQTGVSLDNALMLQQHTAARAQQMGIEPILAVQATQGALGFGGAYRAQGHGAHTAWGAMNSDQVQQLDANLRVQASSSNMANRMAVAMRLADTTGGFDKDSAAGRYTQAVKGGLNQFRDGSGNLRSVMLSDADFTRMMVGAQRGGKSAGITEGDIQGLMGQTQTNREYVEKYNLGAVTRRAQGPDELHPFVGHRMQETLYQRLRDNLIRQGVSDGDASQQAGQAAEAVSQKASKRIFQMSTEDFSDTNSRNKAIGEIIRDELRTSGQGGVLRGLGKQEDAFLKQTADQFYGYTNRAIQGSMYSAFGSLQNVHRLTNQTTLNEADRQQMQARFTSEMQESMAPLGRGSILSRAVDALQDTRSDDPQAMQKVIARALGGVKTDDINRAMMPQFRKIMDRRKLVEDLQNKIAKTTDPGQRAELMAQLDVQRRELTSQAQELVQTTEQFGVFSNDSLGHDDLARAGRTTRTVMTAQNDIAGLRGDFGHEVSKDQIAAARGRKGQASPVEAAAVLLARRQSDVDALQRYVGSGSNMSGIQSEIAKLEAITTRSTDQNTVLASLKEQLGTATAQRKDADAALTPEQRATLKAMADGFKQQSMKNGAPTINDAQAQMMAVQFMSANVGNIPRELIQQQMKNLDVRSDDEARALVRTQRRLVPMRASDEDISKILEENKGAMTRDEAVELANARLRAKRLGVDSDEIARIKKEKKFTGPQGEIDAINVAFSNRVLARGDIDNDDRAAFKKDMPGGYRDPNDEQIHAYKKKTPELEKADDATVKQHMLDRAILMQRQKGQRQRFGEFWSGEEGQAFRESVDMAGQDVDNVALRLVQTPQMVQRLGSRAVEMHEELRTGQQRLRELALYHSYGDMARLTAGDLKTDMSTKEGFDSASRTREEVSLIQRQQRAIIHELQEQEGQQGRRFQLGDSGEARRRVLEKEVIAGRMKPDEMQKLLSTDVSPMTQRTLAAHARELGSEAKAREIIGIGAREELSDFQRAQIAGVRFGAGNEEEAIGIYGQERWAALSRREQEEALKTMRAGTGDRRAALGMLGLTEEKLRTDPTGANEKRVQAITVGLQTDAHARQLAGKDNLTPEQLKSLRLGIGTEDWARDRMGLGEDKMSPALRMKVQREREMMGNSAEAARLLGNKKSLTPDQQKQLEQLTYDIGIARRLSPQQEVQIRSFQETEERMQKMAERQGSSVEEMRLAAARGFREGPEEGRGIRLDGEALKQRDAARDIVNAKSAERAKAMNELQQVQTKLNDPALTADQRRTLLARRDALTKTIGEAQQGEEKARRGLSGLARGMGVTTTELLAGQRSKSKLTDLTDDERNRMDQSTRENRQAEYQASQGNTADALLTKESAQSRVRDDAARRGVSVQEYLSQGMGRTTSDEQRDFTEADKRRTSQSGLVENIARNWLGGAIKVSDLFGATTITKQLQGLQSAALRKENESTQDTVKGMLQEYGFQQSSDSRLAGLMEGTRGRAMGRRVVETAKTLRERAELLKGGKTGLAGVDDMAKSYFAAMQAKPEEREAKRREFLKQYGFETSHGQLTGQGESQFRQFQQAMQFQQQTGLLGVGRDRSDNRTKNREEDLAAMFTQAMQGGAITRSHPSVPGVSGAGMPGRMEMGGTVTLRGDQLDMSGAWGGYRGAGVPGGT